MTEQDKFIAFQKIILILGAVALIGLFIVLWFISEPQTTQGAAPSGLPASNASTSQIAVTAGTVSSPVATSTSCSARVVATASTTAMIHVGDQVPTASLGYFVAASTTLVLDGGIYGCGTVKVYPFATGAITVTETQ